MGTWVMIYFVGESAIQMGPIFESTRRIIVKYLVMMLLSVCVLASSAWAGVEVGQIPKEVELKGDVGGRLDGSPWSSKELKGKVHVVFYVDPDEKDLNNDTSEALRLEKFPKDQYQSYAIINMDATWLPNFAISSALEEKQKKYPNAIYVRDYDKILVKEWNLADDNSDVLAFDKNGKLIFMKAGKLTPQDIQKLIGLVRENLNQ